MINIASRQVKCLYCGKSFNPDKEEFVKPRSNRYAHKSCADQLEQEVEKEKDDLAILIEYIQEIYGYEKVPAGIFKQINQFITENQYTHSGIYKTLKYFYEVKHGSVEKSQGRISIVPYVYDEAKRYYYAIWEAQQKNIDKNFDEIILPTKEIQIKSPRRETMGKKRRLFSFLDEEGE